MLAENMKTVLATSYAFGVRAQQFHWNVMGPDFGQLHDQFGKIYSEVFDSIDVSAEIIRSLGTFAPGSFTEFAENSMIEDLESSAFAAMEMVEMLADDNEIVIDVLKTAYETSELEQEYDVSDFLAGRLAAHKKHGWMLNAYLNRQRQQT
jgi:starvation-inducible DNA-binding protein